jgi:hypothetical protein
MHSRDAWDEYWKNQLKFGPMEVSVNDGLSSNASLPGLLSQRGSRTILCVGNGLSSEPVALALHGFHVTALDISAVPAEVLGRTFRHPDHPVSRIPGFDLSADDSVTFGSSGLIDPELCPPMHRSTDHPPRAGGSLSFVTGDLTNPQVCPGPFDVIIERRTLQLFQDQEQTAALESLEARLADRGTFVSQQHSGGWRPGDSRTHYAAAWLSAHDFVLECLPLSAEVQSARRLACLIFSSG